VNYWLIKSEPFKYSWDDLARDGRTYWDGVRNAQAGNNMKAMAKGDRGFFYHSVNEKRIVGVVEVCAVAHPDSTTDDPRWECVDVKAVAPFPRPVTLAEIKDEPRLSELALVRQSRLSVVPVAEADWRLICAMGGYER